MNIIDISTHVINDESSQPFYDIHYNYYKDQPTIGPPVESTVIFTDIV